MALALQPATDADIPDVVALMNSAYRGTGAEAGWTTESTYIQGTRTTQDLLREEIEAHPQGALLIAKQPDQALHTCVWLQPLTADTWYLGSLSVRPALQNAGIGRELLTAAEQWAAARGANTVRITVVNVRTRLLAWYARRGYRLTGETEPFPYGDTRFGTPLRDDLFFHVLEKPLDPSQAPVPSRQPSEADPCRASS